jgi:hypothetical protein
MYSETILLYVYCASIFLFHCSRFGSLFMRIYSILNLRNSILMSMNVIVYIIDVIVIFPLMIFPYIQDPTQSNINTKKHVPNIENLI